jgi:hypothetical protein
MASSQPKVSGAQLFLLAVVFVASVGWMISWAVLVSSSEVCSETGTDFWSRHVFCLSANEIGDALAGAFAPLAFLWLMTAVFLQSSELRAQRHELQFTREEMELTRGVLAEQRLEAKRSADILGEQLSVFREDARRSRQAVTDAEMDTLYPVLRGSLSRTAARCKVVTETTVYQICATHGDPSLSLDDELEYSCRESATLIEDVLTRNIVRVTNSDDLVELDMILHALENAFGSEDASAVATIRYTSLGITRLATAVSSLVEKVGLNGET